MGKFNTESCIPDDTITSSNLANIRFTTDGSVDRDGFRIETTGGTSRRHTNSQKKNLSCIFLQRWITLQFRWLQVSEN